MRVKQANYIDGYKIEILFSDGVSKIVDFSNFLKTAKHVFIPLKDIDYFKKFIVDEITLSWPNDADFDPELLYEMGELNVGNERSSKISPKPIRRKSESHAIKANPVAKRISKKIKK